MKRLLITPALVAALMVTIVLPAHAGPVMGKGQASEHSLKNRPDTVPLRCKGPINMSNGMVIPKGKVVTSLKYRYIHKDKLYDGDHERSGNYAGKYERTNKFTQLTVKAGIFDGFEARVMLPYVEKHVRRKAGNTPKHADSDTVSGIGDIVLMGRYALLQQKKGDWLNIAIGAGAKLPTGDADKRNPPPFSNSHEYMGPGAQAGTGSWDPKFELGLTKFIDRSRFDAHFMATLPGDGAHGSRKGNQYKYNFGYGYALNQYFDTELELNGVIQEAHIYDGEETVNTGGHTIFVTPGLHWKITPKTHLAVGVPVVIYRDLNGEENVPEKKSKFGLGEDFQIVTRLGITF